MTEIPVEQPKFEEKIVSRVIEDEMKKSYIDYAMSVIVGRALPDVRDGLKPVHRRVLYSMNELGLTHGKPFKKSARIVGDTLGKYHPHGDVSVYDTIVRLAQDFAMRYPLVQGQGNFGSVDGDPAASMRYTEARLTKIAEEILDDLEKGTVDFVDNFDGSLKEPTVLPCKLPNLLINGSSGIAVGMATNIPPHNVKEMIDATIHLLENPTARPIDLLQFVKGPDFPTGGIILGQQGIVDYFSSGRGKIKVRARCEIREEKNRQKIIVNEIPYQVNKSVLIETIADLVRDKKIVGISDIRDESDRDGMRIVIEIKKDANPEVVLNQLYGHTNLEVTFGIIMLSLVHNEPKVLNIQETMQQFILHRQVVVRRRITFELIKAQDRCHILEGLIIALVHIEEVIQKIKQSKDVQTATNVLITDYSLTEIQAKAILDMKLQKLASLEQEKINTEHDELIKFISELQEILASEDKIKGIIKQELLDGKDTYADGRKTEIIVQEGAVIEDIDLIKPEDVVVTVTHTGYVKRIPVETYKQQGRGGKGILGADTKEEDFVEHLFIANTHSYLLAITNRGQLHWLKIYEIPEASRQAMGKSIANLLELREGEKVSAFLPVKEFDKEHFVVIVTKEGTVKKTNLEEYSRPRKGGIVGITLGENDSVIEALITDGKKQLLIATKNGNAVRFDESDVRSVGRSAMGVRGILLKEDDCVIGFVIANEDGALLTITESGYGKRTLISEYRLINRGGSGVINIQTSERNGSVVCVKAVSEENDIILISQKGIIIRMPVRAISIIGRNTQGVRIMRLLENDKVKAAALIQE